MTYLKSDISGFAYRSATRFYKYRGTTATIFMSAVFAPLSAAYAAEGTRPAYTPPPAVSSGNIVQIIFSLLLVLAAIVLVAWLLKRMNVAQHSPGKLLKVLGAVPLGQRERIVLVEVNDTCLVVGIGPGQIRTLHTFAKTAESGQNQKALHPALSHLKTISPACCPLSLPSANKKL